MGKPKNKRHAKNKLPALPKARKGRDATVTSTRLREPVPRKEYKMKLPVQASSREVAGAAAAMAEEVHKDTELRDESREANADFRARRSAITERMKELADTIEKGTHLVDVRVAERFLVETNEIEIIRLDTSEVVERRTAKAADRQEVLFPGEPTDPTFDEGEGDA